MADLDELMEFPDGAHAHRQQLCIYYDPLDYINYVLDPNWATNARQLANTPNMILFEVLSK